MSIDTFFVHMVLRENQWIYVVRSHTPRVGCPAVPHEIEGQVWYNSKWSITHKYHTNTTFLQTTLIHQCIPKQWLCKLKICNNIAPIHKLDIKLKVNKKYTSITQITCKDFYWHIIDKQKHTPTNVKKVVHNIYRFQWCRSVYME